MTISCATSEKNITPNFDIVTDFWQLNRQDCSPTWQDTMAFNHWPSLLLSVAILFGITICFRRLDYMAVNEVKALISVIFGFATSCLLLSFIWLLQRRHSVEPWPLHNTSNLVDAPSMHPEGVPVADNTPSSREQRQRISTVSASMDQPPHYADALANSKPVKINMKQTLISLCQRHSSEFNGKMAQDHQVGPARDCCICLSTPSKQRISETGVTGLAINLIRTSHDRSGQEHGHQDHGGRKRSFCQLDVGRLLSSSPPKYHELNHKLT